MAQGRPGHSQWRELSLWNCDLFAGQPEAHEAKRPKASSGVSFPGLGALRAYGAGAVLWEGGPRRRGRAEGGPLPPK
jgi:hypothetical protein